MTLLTDRQIEELVKAGAAAIAEYHGGEDNEDDEAHVRLALTAALPAIERAVLGRCLNETAAVAYQQDADHGAANTCGADEVLHRLRALAGEVG